MILALPRALLFSHDSRFEGNTRKKQPPAAAGAKGAATCVALFSLSQLRKDCSCVSPFIRTQINSIKKERRRCPFTFLFFTFICHAS